MQWSNDRNSGFSDADAAALFFPLIVDPPYGWEAVNVAAQERTQTSLLRWMRRIITVRQQYRQVFGRGTLEFLLPENRRVLAYLRQDGDQTMLCVNNLSRFVQPVELNLQRFCDWAPVELIGNIPFPKITTAPYFLTLGPHNFYWFRLERPTGAAAATAGSGV